MKKPPKHQTYNDSTTLKHQWRLFEPISMATKNLHHIPQLWPQIRRFRLPWIQYIPPEVISGLHFIPYAQHPSLSHPHRFVCFLLQHLQGCSATLTGSRIQTNKAVSSSEAGRP